MDIGSATVDVAGWPSAPGSPWSLAGLALAAVPAAAQAGPPAKPGSSPTPWNTGTAPPPAPAARRGQHAVAAPLR